jgi:acyl-CoA thioesterase I
MSAVLGGKRPAPWLVRAARVAAAVCALLGAFAPAFADRGPAPGAAHAAHAGEADGRPAVQTVLVFGDSLSAGYGLRASEAWPSLLQARLGAGFKVVNASVSGETTAGGLTRLPAALAEHQPRLLVLELGGNDGLRGLPLAAAEKNLAAMIDLGQRAGAKVLLVSVRLPPNLGGAYTGRFQAMYERLAAAWHLPAPPFLLEGMADKRELFQADQIHPVASAQPTLAGNVYPALLALARR